MTHPVFILICTQCLFAISDVIGRAYMVRYGFQWSSFISFWFLAYTLVRQLATFGLLYTFANFSLGKTITMIGAASIVSSNLVGLLYLGEQISSVAYLGICLAILAFIVMGFR